MTVNSCLGIETTSCLWYLSLSLSLSFCGQCYKLIANKKVSLKLCMVQFAAKVLLYFVNMIGHAWFHKMVFLCAIFVLLTSQWLLRGSCSVWPDKNRRMSIKVAQKWISLEKLKILTPLQNLPKNVGDLGQLFVAKGFEKLPKVQKIAKSGHTAHVIK